MFNLTPAEVEEAITTSATLDIAAGRLGISRKKLYNYRIDSNLFLPQKPVEVPASEVADAVFSSETYNEAYKKIGLSKRKCERLRKNYGSSSREATEDEITSTLSVYQSVINQSINR